MSTSHWSGRWRCLLDQEFRGYPESGASSARGNRRDRHLLQGGHRDESPAEQLVPIVPLEPHQGRAVVGGERPDRRPFDLRSSRKPGSCDRRIGHRTHRHPVPARPSAVSGSKATLEHRHLRHRAGPGVRLRRPDAEGGHGIVRQLPVVVEDHLRGHVLGEIRRGGRES